MAECILKDVSSFPIEVSTLNDALIPIRDAYLIQTLQNDETICHPISSIRFPSYFLYYHLV